MALCRRAGARCKTGARRQAAGRAAADLGQRPLPPALDSASKPGNRRADRLRQLDCRDVLESRPPAEHGVVVCNPPYGVRLDDQDRLAELYPRLGDWLKQHWSGWNAFSLPPTCGWPN